MGQPPGTRVWWSPKPGVEHTPSAAGYSRTRQQSHPPAFSHLSLGALGISGACTHSTSSRGAVPCRGEGSSLTTLCPPQGWGTGKQSVGVGAGSDPAWDGVLRLVHFPPLLNNV